MAASASHSLVTELNEADFAKEVEQSSIPVFIDFWAPWCAPCVALTPVFEALAKDYGDQIKFVKANLDDNKEIAQRFNIRGVPSLLLFQNGQVVERIGGSKHKAYFSSLLDKYVQRPVAKAKKPTSSFRAFHGDARLRETVAERVRTHIEAGRIVTHGSDGPISDADQQRYSLMGAVAETADVRRFENTLGIPASVGRLQEAVHSLLIRQIGERDDARFRLDPPHDAWPVDWWRAIPPGADLQSLTSRFLHWFLSDLVGNTNRYGLDLPGATCAALGSLAQLHARTAQGDVPTAEEWQDVRVLVGTLLKSLYSGGDEADRPALTLTVLECVEQLTWPAEVLDDTPVMAIGQMLFVITHALPPDGYTPKQWADANRRHVEAITRFQKAVAERGLYPSPDMTPKQTQGIEKAMEALEEFKALREISERFEPLLSAHRAKVRLNFGEHLHAGLMQALSATVSSDRP